MPRKQPRRPDHELMSGEVERLLRKLRPEPPPGPTVSAPSAPAASPLAGSRGTAPPPRARAAGRPAAPGRPGAAAGAARTGPVRLPSIWGVRARVLLATLLTVGLTQWPYPTCGLPLAGYFAATAVALVAGAWAAYASWRRRMGPMHGVAIGVIFTGLVLVGLQVLARTAYVAAQVPWGCPG